MSGQAALVSRISRGVGIFNGNGVVDDGTVDSDTAFQSRRCCVRQL